MKCIFMVEQYDIVVVGGGPAGLMTAKTAAKNGLTVLLVDQKRNIAKIGRACCSMFILDPGFHGEFVSINGNQIHFPRNDCSVNYSGEWVDLSRSIRMAPSGSTFTLGDGKKPFVKVIEKEVLVEGLLDEAVKTGVEIQNQTIGVEAENLEDGTKVLLKTAEGTREVRGKVTIAADGVHSRIASSLGVNEKRKVFGKGAVVSYFLEGVKCPYPNAWIRFLGGETQGRGYLLPKPTRNKGAPHLYEFATKSEVLLKKIIYDSKYSSWFRDSRIVRRRAAVGALYAPITQPVVGRVMLISDVASWQEVEIQGALMCGYRAAHAAIQELEEGGNALQNYTHFWNSAFEFCWPGVVERSMKFYRMHTTLFNNDELDYIYDLTSHDTIPGTLNHFRAGIHEVRAYMNHIEHIRKNKPALAKKLEELENLVKYQ
jgi:flavin-dependent dehydrogenase